jgi:beta-lactamase regulating signal transducer with metallopeptidase domain/regulation of enolase protein 1 (concanavalin A-like superfamily)
MQDYLTQLIDYLLRQSWQIAVLVLLIAAVSWLLRNRSAHTRYLLWLIVLAKCLVPPLLAIPLPVLPHEQPREPVSTAPLLIPAWTFDAEHMTNVEFFELYSHPVQSRAAPSAVQEPSKPTLRPTLTARQRLGLLWIGGVLVFIVAASTKALRTILWLRRKRKPLPDKLQADIEKLFEGKGFGTFPKVWLIRGIGQPFVWGLMRGSIYLPAHFVRIDNAGHRRDVLGHELSHVLRLDAAVNVLQIVAQAIFWFHPFVWWANKRIRAEREKCCDEMAISRLGAQAKSYSAAILNTLIADCKSTRPVPSLAIAGPVKNIEERIKTIMKPGKRFYKNPSLLGGFAVLLVALLTVPTALVLTARAEKANPAAEQLAENGADVSELADSDQNSAAGADKPAIPEANLQIPDDLKPCAERLRTIYDALKRYEEDKGSLPDWLSNLVPDYLDAEMLIWPQDGPRSTPLAREPHLPCSFGYQYSGSLSLPTGEMSYREFKDRERKVWGDVVPLVRYYIGKKCLNVSFDGRIYMSTTTWEREIQRQPGAPEILILREVSVPASPGTSAVRPGTQPWGPEQATGAPDTDRAGDLPTAWAPLEPDAGREWLKVDFERAVSIAGVRVRQTFNPGAISKVAAVENGRELVLWQGQDPTFSARGNIDLILLVDEPCPDDASELIKGYSELSVLIPVKIQVVNGSVEIDKDLVCKSIKIYLDTTRKRGWNEIDAVQLFGKDGSRQWASHATASSTYATRVTPRRTTAAGVSRTAAPPATATRPATAKAKVLAFDDFDGKFSLDWEIIHRDPSHYSLTKNPGTLTITTQEGHFKEANADYKNLFLIDTPGSQGQDFQITTCLSGFRPLQAYNQAGLICWDDEDNYLQWIFQKMSRRGLRFAAGVEAAGPTRYTYVPAGGPFDRLWLRVTKRGSSYECASSTDGKSFTVHTVEQWGDGSPKQIGLFAINGSLTNPPEVDASFEFFEVNSAGAQAAPITGPKHRVISPDHRQTPSAGAGTPKFTIPEANLQIPNDMRGCAEKLRIIYAALVKYQEDKGQMPHWLSDLVPDYLGAETLFCPDDPSHRTRFWPDPKLPCSYCYELNPTELHRQPPFDKTMCHYKTLQRKLFGDVVPIVRCFHHERALNLSWDGQIYTSAVMFERLFIPNYSRNMLFEEPTVKPTPGPISAPGEAPGPARKGKVLALDDFDGKLGLEWDIVNPNSSNYSLTKKPGTLTITTKKGHFSKDNKDYENVFLLDLPATPAQDFQITTCLSSFQPKAHWNQAGILCWDDEDNYLKLVYEWAGRTAFTVGHEVNGHDRYTYRPAPSKTDRLWLRITKQGASYRCASSTDGKSFASCGSATWNENGPERVGIFANNGSFWRGAVPDLDASFEFFEVATAPPERVEAAGEIPAVSYKVDLEAFFEEMDNTYPFFDLKGIRDDWESTKKRLRQEVKNCESDEKFLQIVTDAVMCLRDSHMWFRNTKVSPPRRPPRYCPGICFWPATNQRVIIAHGREELDPDLKAGTVVTKIDGRDARQYLEERAKARWADGGISGPQRARIFAYRIALRGEEKGEKHTITILADGQEQDIELTSDMEARGWAHFYNLPKDMTQAGRSSWYTTLPSGAGYIYLRRVDNSTGPGLKEAFSKYPDAKGWIIDLRGNGGGGYDQALYEALQQLPRPLAVLIDAGCTSAGETLARDFVRHGDARLFGSKTAGSSSAKRTWTFPSGIASLSVPTRSRWGIDGNPIEFLGIEPHVKVEAVPEEVQRGLNSGILRAQKYLAEATSSQGNKSKSE